MSIDKLDLQSPDLVNANFQKLAELFPNCVTESSDGKAIDFDLLKQELNHAVVEGNKERYRLEWPGKKEAIVTANLPTNKTLRPIREDSVDFDNTENLYIEGDNLEVLKLLQESYLGKVKMIYIDPPYNTGKDFVYKDNFARDAEEELKESGQRDEYNQRLVANPETSGRYHSDWLSMMYPRLKLARNLLKEDGVIFISIDDNEVHNLRKMCDEVFGESNFVATLMWKRKKEISSDTKNVAIQGEYILSYSKSNLLELNLEPLSKGYIEKSYNDPTAEFPLGKWRPVPITVSKGLSGGGYEYEIITPSGIKHTRVFAYPPKSFEKLVLDKRVYFGKNNDGIPQRVIYDFESKGQPTTNYWDNTSSNKAGKKEILELFSESIFDTPKPTELIKRLSKLIVSPGDFILDFFAGSSVVAHAVMQLNSEDGGCRKYVMVQVPELTDEKSEAFKAGYKNICEIRKERIRRAANKIKAEKAEKAQKDGLFADYKDEQDYGFRVYRLDESNMQDVYYKPQDYKQGALDLFADNVKPDRTPDDLLAQVMLDWGLPLSYKIERVKIAGKEVIKVAQDSLLACFDKGLDEAFAKEIAKEKPLRVVFRDNGFVNDTAKENVKQLLKQLTPETEMKVI